jgi:chromosome segregation ATPase
VNEKVTPHSQLTRANENQDFWSSYAVKLSGSAAPTVETDKTMNAPPPRSIRNVQVSYSAIAQKNTGSKAAATASTTSETAASSTSTISDAHNDKDDDSMQRLKRKLAEIDQERSQFKTQQQKVEDDVSTLTQSMTKMGNDILNIRQDMAKLNQQLHEITTLLKQNIGQAGKIREPTIKSPTRKRRGKKDTNSFSSNEERSGSWASDCDSEEEKRKRQAKGAAGIEDMVVESGILGNM